MKQIIYLISLIIILGACTDEKYGDTLSSGAGAPGKLVPVELVLHTQPMQSPLPTGTKAGSNIVSSTQVCKGMEISLVETPVTRAALEDEIVNFIVLQFNGTDSESRLALKQFVPNNSVENVDLSKGLGDIKCKIIVIANADQSLFNSLTIDVTTLTEFNNMGILYNDNPTFYPLFSSNVSTPRVVFIGSTDMVVTPNKQVDVMLYRSVAQVKVSLSLSQEMQNKGYTWSYQFMQIPDRSFYYSIGRTAGFPGATVGYINYSQQVTTMPATIDNIYLPVNLHQPVPFTTPEMRVTNAPVNATYLQLVGIQATSAGVISNSVVYQIHLGSNFTDDYNISPNYSYTYNINITGESDDDSRVVKFVAGYFGGSLKMYNEDVETTILSEADTWRYEKRIEVYVNDVNPTKDGVAWVQSGSSMPSSLNDLMNGRQNTLDLNQNIDRYPAAKLCIGLNPTTPVTNENMVWYMPSYGQSLGIYVAGSKTLKSLPNTTYWSSTANLTFAWGTQVWSGQSSQVSPATPYSLRCVKDLEQTNVIP